MDIKETTGQLLDIFPQKKTNVHYRHGFSKRN